MGKEMKVQQTAKQVTYEDVPDPGWSQGFLGPKIMMVFVVGGIMYPKKVC